MMLKIKRLLKGVKSFFYPPLCVSCHTVMGRDSAHEICPICMQKWESAKSSLRNRLGAVPAVPFEIECKSGVRESFVASLVNYRQMSLEQGDSLQKHLIFELKRHDYKGLVNFLARELTQLIKDSFGKECSFKDFTVVSIPRSPKNLIATANDGVGVLSRECARILGAEYAGVFYKRLFSKEQKLLNSKQRGKHIIKALYMKKNAPELLHGRKIIIIDDVITTGSSVGRAAQLLYDEAGVSDVYIYSVANNADLLMRKI